MDSSQQLSTSSKDFCFVKEGYLDIKYPPGKQDRKFGKVWHQRWTVASVYRENSSEATLRLKFFVLKPCLRNQAAPFVEFRDVQLLFRSCSKSRPHKSFGIASCRINLKVLMYLSADDERQAQVWMKVLRDALFPPKPSVYCGEKSEKRHYVSLIDNENSFQRGFLGSYGYIAVKDANLAIWHAHTGQVIVQWSLKTLRDVKMNRFDYENSSSGVFSVSFQYGKESHKQTWTFYSPTAQEAAKTISEYSQFVKVDDQNVKSRATKFKLNLKPFYNESGKRSKFNEVENSKQVANTSNESSKRLEGSERTVTLGPTLKRLAGFSGDILNSSITSAFNPTDKFVTIDSDDSDDGLHVPPDFLDSSEASVNCCHDETLSTMFKRNQSSDPTAMGNLNASAAECTLDLGKHKHLLEMKNKSGVDITNLKDNDSVNINTGSQDISNCTCVNKDSRLSSFASDCHVYSDISCLQNSSRKVSVSEETLYEEVQDVVEERCLRNPSVPPLPPPRKARRPTTLGLEALSSNIETTLEDSQNFPTPSRSEKKSWIRSFKGIKKILRKDWLSKSDNSSPTEDTYGKNHDKKKKYKTESVKRVVSAPIFINKAQETNVSPTGSLRDANVPISMESGSPISFLPPYQIELNNDIDSTCAPSTYSDNELCCQLPKSRSLNGFNVDEVTKRCSLEDTNAFIGLKDSVPCCHERGTLHDPSTTRKCSFEYDIESRRRTNSLTISMEKFF